MYIPRLNRMTDLDTMTEFMQQHNFAIVVSAVDNIPVATHLPFTIARSEDNLRLHSHFAKANPQWQTITESDTLVIFSGPHAYISPTHYDKTKSVPTWDYITVHAYGRASLVDFETQPDALEAMIMEMVDAHEPDYREQWDQLSQRYKDGMKQGVVGIEIEVTRLEGKAKLSQNKSATEQERIADSLMHHPEGHVMQVGYAMMNTRQSPIDHAP